MKLIRTLGAVALTLLGVGLQATSINFHNKTDYKVEMTVSRPLLGLLKKPITVKGNGNFSQSFGGMLIEWIRFRFNGKKASELFSNPSSKFTGDFYYDSSKGDVYYNVGGTWGDSSKGYYDMTLTKRNGKLHLKAN